jgi:hypothetical protein
LEAKQQEFGISTFGIAVTTLEDVFLRVAEKIDNIKGGSRKKKEE